MALAADKFLAETVQEAKELGALRVGDKRPQPAMSLEVGGASCLAVGAFLYTVQVPALTIFLSPSGWCRTWRRA